MGDLERGLLESLGRHDRGRCVELALTVLDRGEVGVIDLYDILTRSLNEMRCEDDLEICIWREHVRSSIIRTVLECCYPYVMKERKRRGYAQGGKVLVICPSDEYHDIGSRMAADFFLIAGFEVVHVGGNTPRQVTLSVVRAFRPDYVAISISNYYHLFSAKKDIAEIREHSGTGPSIIVGGSAFADRPEHAQEIGADLLVQSFEDVVKLREGNRW